MDEQPEGAQYINQAEPNAKVGQQIGHIDKYVKKVVHKHTHRHRDGPPTAADIFAEAREYLALGASARAANLIGEAVAKGHRSAQVAYYWHLAVLAGKPFDHLTSVDQEMIRSAQEMARESPDGAWKKAVEVVIGLLDSFSTNIEAGDDDIYRFDNAFRLYEALPEQRRAEMGRHLALVFSGGLQNRLDEERRRQIDKHRMGKDRRRRVPLFFEPDPAEPRPRQAVPPRIRLLTWVKFWFGVLAFVLGVALLMSRALEQSPARASVLGALLLAGCAGMVLLWPRIVERRLRMRPGDEGVWVDVSVGPEWIELRRTEINTLIAQNIASVEPADRAESERFRVAVRSEVRALSEALHTLYATEDGESIAPQQIDWLVRWHAQRLRASWSSSQKPSDAAIPMITWALALLATATSILVCSLLMATIATWSVASVGTIAGAAVLLGVGAAGAFTGTVIRFERRRYAAESASNARLHREELAAWRDEQDRLADRPKDAEMAEWLDYDKDHIRLSAMKNWGLRNGNILAHVVLTEPRENSPSAREVMGPRRYAYYVVRLFLLTDNGVRALDVHLDFATGAENREIRHAFRYEAIASAWIQEPSVRRHGRRQVASPDGGGPKGVNRMIRRQSLHLTLVNGEEFDINANYEDLLAEEDRDDHERLLILEMETSGAVSTLRTLETVAGEGREWLRNERARNRRTANRYQKATDSPG